MKARYFSSTQGRFTSPDPLLGIARRRNPQNWNRYTYCVNNPLKYVDPTGLEWVRNLDNNEITWVKDISTLDKKQRYEVLTGDRLNYNISDTQSVSLNPNGPDATAAPGTVAYQGWSYGDHIADTSVSASALLAPLAITQVDSPAPGPADIAGGALFFATLFKLATQPSPPFTAHPPTIPPIFFARKKDLGVIDHVADKYGIDRETLAEEVEERKRTVGRGGLSIGKDLVEEIAREIAGLGAAETDVEDHVNDKPKEQP